MKENNKSMIKQLREYRGLSRKEVAEQSGINLRSLQDYEQGHKEIASAKADTLYRLSLVLDCSMETLLQQEQPEHMGEQDTCGFVALDIDKQTSSGASGRLRMLAYYNMLIQALKNLIEEQEIYSSQYKVHGRWKLEGERCYLTFCYKGEIVKLPFQMHFSTEMIPWLIDVAELKMNQYIRSKIYDEMDMMEGGENWYESRTDLLPDAPK